MTEVPLGKLVATPGAIDALKGDEMMRALARHAHGDWGTVCLPDAKANDHALEVGERVLSAYATKDGVKFWIITEADRSSTCILLPSEY